VKLPSHLDLALLAPAARPFSRAGWIFELKYDGYRVLGLNRGGHAQLLSRNGRDMAASFPEVAEDLRNLPDGTAIDGELVVMDVFGHPLFDRLRRRAMMTAPVSIDHAAHHEPAALFAFDLLAVKGVNYRRYPLKVRKHRLRTVLQHMKRIVYAEHVEDRGVDLYVEAARRELEGIVAKPYDAPYVAGRSSGWVKIKTAAGRERDAHRAEDIVV
jgi:bifunctional non-homologous end joining protein LigD